MPKNRLSPHDRFAKSLMINKKVIQEFFEKNLPDSMKEKVDLSTIEPQNTSFVDDKLRLNVADLLYSVKIQEEEGYFYVLLEHQSTPDKLMPFRLLKYMTGIMDYHLKKEGGTKLPFIFPIILYTGEKPYPYSTDFFDLFKKHKDLAQDTWLKPFSLVDLSRIPDEELKKYTYFGAMALLAKHIHDSDVLPALKSMLHLLKELEKRGEADYIYVTLSYIVEAGEVSSKEEFMKTINQLKSVTEGKIMTIAEMFKAEGKAEGKAEERLEIALSMLRKGISESTVSEVTGLSIPQIESLKKQIH